MAPRRKRKEQQPEETRGEAHEPPSVPADALAGPWDEASGPPALEVPASPSNDNPPETGKKSRTRRAVEKLRSVMGRYFKGKKVEMIDDGNAGGVGIKLTYDDPAERPSEDVKQIIKAPAEGNYPGLSFTASIKQWRKKIGADADPKRATAIRLDAERRFEAVSEQMSHEERLKSEREQDGNSGPGMPS